MTLRPPAPTCALLGLVAAALLGAPSPLRAAPSALTEISVATPPDATSPAVDVPFRARGDQVLTGAELLLSLAPAAVDGVRALEVSVNGETLASLDTAALAGDERSVTVAPELLAGANTLTLRLVSDETGTCGKVPHGAWGLLRSAVLRLRSDSLPMPDNLAVLPLPFVDRAYDHEAVVAFGLPADARVDSLRLAGLAAGWFGVQTSVALRFEVAFGALPATNAVVLLEGAEQAATLGLPAPTGPSVRMMNHPSVSGAKLLVLGGRDHDELERAVRGFASNRVALAGPSLAYEAVARPAPSSPYAVPRWTAADQPVVLGAIPGAPALVHQGLSDGILQVSFRVAPDLWTWPRDAVALDLDYEVTGTAAPRLDAEFNGQFLATLPAPVGGAGRAHLLVPAHLVRGFNALRVYIRYPGDEPRCDVNGGGEVRVRVLPSSTLHLEGLPHFARVPDLGAFVDDGWPFTRRADLGEAAVVLPGSPSPDEAGALLSVLAHLASITGAPPWGAVYFRDDIGAAQPQRDLLVVGTSADLPLLRRWAPQLPLGPSLAPQLPQPNNWLLDALSLGRGWRELGRAREVVSRAETIAAVMGAARPGSSDRSVVVVTGTSGALPAMPRLRGFAESRQSGGDLLVVDGERRWMFHLGVSRGAGALDLWTRARWFLARNPVLLVPFLSLGAVLLAAQGRARLARMAARRLGAGEEPRP